MAYTFMGLEEALHDLPTLRKVLGQKWIERESKTPVLESDFPLARTLRIEELRNLVVSLDRSLDALRDVDGARDWRRRLRKNGEEFRAVLAETSFAMLLLRLGIKFIHPSDGGPDFAVMFDDSPPIKMEVTSPHTTFWADELDGRLWILSRQYGHRLRTEPLAEGTPILHEKVDKALMVQIVRDSEEFLRRASPGDGPFERTWTCIGLKLIWTPCEDPVNSGIDSPGSSHVHAFRYIATAAKKKAEQMEKGDAHTLVIGRNMLPFPEFEIYVHSLRNNVPFHGDFDWSQVPDQVKHIVLFLATYDEEKRPGVIVLSRPGEESNGPAGFDRFLEAMQQADSEHMQQEAEETTRFLERMTRDESDQRKRAADDAE
jgi:hypothetical protein